MNCWVLTLVLTVRGTWRFKWLFIPVRLGVGLFEIFLYNGNSSKKSGIAFRRRTRGTVTTVSIGLQHGWIPLVRARMPRLRHTTNVCMAGVWITRSR
jgi:hypothetical protein